MENAVVRDDNECFDWMHAEIKSLWYDTWYLRVSIENKHHSSKTFEMMQCERVRLDSM